MGATGELEDKRPHRKTSRRSRFFELLLLLLIVLVRLFLLLRGRERGGRFSGLQEEQRGARTAGGHRLREHRQQGADSPSLMLRRPVFSTLITSTTLDLL